MKDNSDLVIIGGGHGDDTCEWNKGNRKLLTLLSLGLYILPTILTMGAVFKNTVLREQCVLETT